MIVVGLGGVGMAALLTAVALGGGEVVAVDGLERSATGPSSSARRGRSARTCCRALARAGRSRADVVVEAAGNARAFEAAVAATAPGGRTVTVGLPHPDARASRLAALAGGRGPDRDRQLPRVGGAGSRHPGLRPVVARGRLPVEALVSSTIALDDLNRAMDELAAGRAVRQVIQF